MSMVEEKKISKKHEKYILLIHIAFILLYKVFISTERI